MWWDCEERVKGASGLVLEVNCCVLRHNLCEYTCFLHDPPYIFGMGNFSGKGHVSMRYNVQKHQSKVRIDLYSTFQRGK
jgi:hypothetical protein